LQLYSRGIENPEDLLLLCPRKVFGSLWQDVDLARFEIEWWGSMISYHMRLSHVIVVLGRMVLEVVRDHQIHHCRRHLAVRRSESVSTRHYPSQTHAMRPLRPNHWIA